MKLPKIRSCRPQLGAVGRASSSVVAWQSWPISSDFAGSSNGMSEDRPTRQPTAVCQSIVKLTVLELRPATLTPT